jgi:SpoVK/Ycf46/Vps4 family AAA+-type ATPase
VRRLDAARLATLAITATDFESAVGKVQPSVRREGFATTPDVTWSDVGALTEVGVFRTFQHHISREEVLLDVEE